MNILHIIVLLGAVISNQGYSNFTQQKPADYPYITITTTTYVDEIQTETVNTNMESACLVYDLSQKQLEEKGAAPYTSMYPLTCFSKKSGEFFYSALSQKGDQLYGIQSGIPTQLTTQLCALNHMFQCNDKLFLSAKYLEHYCIEPVLFDLSSKQIKKLFPDVKDDRFTGCATCDPAENLVYFSYYSNYEMRKQNLIFNDKRHTEEENVYPDAAPSNICAIDMETETVKQVYTTPDYIWGLAVSGKTLYYVGSKSGGSPVKDRICYKVDLESGQKEALDTSVNISSDMAVWNDVLYCIGHKDEIRGVYAIDLATENTTLIYTANERTYINGLYLNY